MYSYKARNVNEALQFAIEHLLREGVEEESRNGPVLVAPGPVCIEYVNPRERVLLSPTRDGNCFFHFFEWLWFATGSNEIEFPCFFNKSYAQFSDDSRTMWDCYGHRWKEFFGYDQLEAIITELKATPTSRRCVLSMWNGMARDHGDPLWTAKDGVSYTDDLGVACNGGKGVPCNTHAYFAIRAGKLNMTVMNRSNDLLFGMLGANVVHFSLLLEYMVMRIGVPMGSYFQFTNNAHAYLEKFDRKKLEQIAHECETVGELLDLGPAIEEGFDADLSLFMPWALRCIRAPKPMGDPSMHPALDVPDCKTKFFHAVAVPMFLTWLYRKWGDEYSSQVCLDGIDAPDWHRACLEWVERRRK